MRKCRRLVEPSPCRPPKSDFKTSFVQQSSAAEKGEDGGIILAVRYLSAHRLFWVYIKDIFIISPLSTERINYF